jgi:hypothetical protein
MDKKFLRLLLVAGMVTALTNTDAKANRVHVTTCPALNNLMIDGIQWRVSTIAEGVFSKANITGATSKNESIVVCQYNIHGIPYFSLNTIIPDGYNSKTCSFIESVPADKPVRMCPYNKREDCSVYCSK